MSSPDVDDVLHCRTEYRVADGPKAVWRRVNVGQSEVDMVVQSSALGLRWWMIFIVFNTRYL